MIGCVSWVLMAGSVWCFWSVDWRLGLGIILAALSFMVDFGWGFSQLNDKIDAVNERFRRG